MPFGKFRGWTLDQIPDEYLGWVVANIDLREPLRSSVLKELHRREPPAELSRRPCPDPQLAEELIGAGRRVLAKQTHPDAGGTHEAFLRLETVKTWLQHVIGSGS